MSTSPTDVTMVKNAIHNPADARHFMRIAEPEHEITAVFAGVELARSQQALKVKEVGYDIYDAVIYFPRADVSMALLEKNSKTTHCPLKGDTEYFDLKTDSQQVENIAWSYNQTLDIASQLQDYIGFDARLVNVAELTAGA